MESNKPRCKKCSSTQTYIKLKDNKRVCRSCGYIEQLNKDKETC